MASLEQKSDSVVPSFIEKEQLHFRNPFHFVITKIQDENRPGFEVEPSVAVLMTLFSIPPLTAKRFGVEFIGSSKNRDDPKPQKFIVAFRNLTDLKFFMSEKSKSTKDTVKRELERVKFIVPLGDIAMAEMVTPQRILLHTGTKVTVEMFFLAEEHCSLVLNYAYQRVIESGNLINSSGNADMFIDQSGMYKSYTTVLDEMKEKYKHTELPGDDDGYNGGFDEKNRRHGRGILKKTIMKRGKEEETLFVGNFFEGELLFGRAEVQGHPHYKFYQGGFLPSSSGSYARGPFGATYFASGAVYIGEFYHGRPHGQGRYVYETLMYYEGKMANGEAEGFGTLFTSGHVMIFRGVWKKDEPYQCEVVKDGIEYVRTYQDFKNGKYTEEIDCSGEMSGAE